MDETKISRPKKWPQIYGALIISLASLNYGTNAGYPTIALPQLEKESNSTTNIYLTENQGSWWAAIMWICGTLFAPVGGEIHFSRIEVIMSCFQ